jgi:hypothetical protein
MLRDLSPTLRAEIVKFRIRKVLPSFVNPSVVKYNRCKPVRCESIRCQT